MSVLIRVDDEPPRTRLDYFRHVVANTIVPFGLHIDGDRDLRAEILTGPVGTVHVTKVSAPPMTAFRTARLIRVSDPELFKVDVQVRGHTVFAQGDREAALAPGDFTLMDLSRPCQLADRDDEHEVLAVKFPHAALPLRHDELERLTAVPFSGRDGLGAPISSLARHLAPHLKDYDLGERPRRSRARSRLAMAPPMRAFYLATKPIVDLFNAMGNLVLKPFGIPPASEAGHSPHSEDELRQLLRESRAGGLIEADESQLSEAALVFGDLRAREVMQPRPDIDYVTIADTTDQVIETAMRTGRTRLPLVEHEGDLDRALGVINAKDLLPAALGKDIDLRSRARPLRGSPKAPASTRCCATCAASGAMSRSWSTSTAP